MSVDNPINVVVLGGYGLIGSACLRALKTAGCAVTGVGRSARHAQRTDPDINWIITDIAQTSVADWRKCLDGIDVVVNASGVLQGGHEVAAIHVDAIRNLTAALNDGQTHLIQISAAGVSLSANTAFFRTKAEGDAIITASDNVWTILRPTIVISPQAYGGTALLRSAAAMPYIHPGIFTDTMMQTIHVADLADAVVSCATGQMPTREIYELSEPDAHRFPDLVRKIRTWQGFSPARIRLPVPAWGINFVGKLADITGLLGWRSPMRTTALKVMQTGVTGDSANWITKGGAPMRPLSETLVSLPSTTQERWFARLYLLIPVAVLSLAIFWIVTGIITLANPEKATAVLTERGMSDTVAFVAVFGGVILDMLLGIAILFRRTAQRACIWMAALSFSYMCLSTVTAPDLWADPLGPFLKILPIIVMCLMTAAILDER